MAEGMAHHKLQSLCISENNRVFSKNKIGVCVSVRWCLGTSVTFFHIVKVKMCSGVPFCSKYTAME